MSLGGQPSRGVLGLDSPLLWVTLGTPEWEASGGPALLDSQSGLGPGDVPDLGSCCLHTGSSVQPLACIPHAAGSLSSHLQVPLRIVLTSMLVKAGGEGGESVSLLALKYGLLSCPCTRDIVAEFSVNM